MQLYTMGEVALGMYPRDRLTRALMISLFTWRRANPSDVIDGDDRMGWWADTLNGKNNDQPMGRKIGSRLWLLAREKLVNETVRRANDYCKEATAWLVEDGVADEVLVRAERVALSEMALRVEVVKDGRRKSIMITGVWGYLNGNVAR